MRGLSPALQTCQGTAWERASGMVDCYFAIDPAVYCAMIEAA